MFFDGEFINVNKVLNVFSVIAILKYVKNFVLFVIYWDMFCNSCDINRKDAGKQTSSMFT